MDAIDPWFNCILQRGAQDAERERVWLTSSVVRFVRSGTSGHGGTGAQSALL